MKSLVNILNRLKNWKRKKDFENCIAKQIKMLHFEQRRDKVKQKSKLTSKKLRF